MEMIKKYKSVKTATPLRELIKMRTNFSFQLISATNKTVLNADMPQSTHFVEYYELDNIRKYPHAIHVRRVHGYFLRCLVYVFETDYIMLTH